VTSVVGASSLIRRSNAGYVGTAALVLALSLVLALGSALALPTDARASQVYVTNESNESISAFSIGGGGALSPIACATGCKTEAAPNGLRSAPTDGSCMS
jgi:hypothetical protein